MGQPYQLFVEVLTSNHGQDIKSIGYEVIRPIIFFD